MLRRVHPAAVAVGGSVAILALSLLALHWSTGSTTRDEAPLYVYCAEALRRPLEAVQKDYERDTGHEVDLHFGPSENILSSLEFTKKGDLFLPADDSYIELARERKLVGEVLPLARMQAVAIVRPGFPRPIASWSDFIADGNTIGLANPDAAAIGKLVRARLQQSGHWDELVRREPRYQTSVNNVLNAALLGSIDVGIVWDTVANPHSKVTQVHLPELQDVKARVEIAVTRFTAQPAEALRFAHYLRDRDKGAVHFKAQGFSSVEEEDRADARPYLVVYAGAMLRPALEETLKEFEQREGVQIMRKYNGCGILVGDMLAGGRPDLYFACDPRFMTQVQSFFAAPTTISSNQLVIAVPTGNPQQIHSLKDLGKKGLRLGVGHEQQCALGSITKETFIRTGVYAAVTKNIKEQAPTGDLLINQLRTGSLDAVVAYISNVTPFADELEAIPVTGIDCALPQQPVAVRKDSAHPELSRRLVEALQSSESRSRFEKLGFRWEIKGASEEQ
jgi:molybdate transport system substrate-binding protein